MDGVSLLSPFQFFDCPSWGAVRWDRRVLPERRLVPLRNYNGVTPFITDTHIKRTAGKTAKEFFK
jgi:hypothetical protein